MKRFASPEKSCAVDADDDDALLAVTLPGGLEARRLRLARRAPRRPEVEHDDLAAQRRELQLPGRVEPRQRELRRGRRPPAAELHALVLVDDLPDQERRAGRATTATVSACRPCFNRTGTRLTMPGRCRPACRPRRGRTATRRTGCTSGCSRATPSSRARPDRACRGCPTPGADRPIQRVPSGLPGPGGIGFAPCAHGESGGYHHGSFHLTTMSKLAERRRVDRLAGRDGEGPPRLHAVVQVELVRPAVDDDHRAERPRG